MIFPSFATNKVPFTIIIGIQTKVPLEIRLQAKDSQKPATYYVNRKGVVNGYREFELKFPQVPENMIVNVFNIANGNYKDDEDKSFVVTKFEAKPLKTNPIWMNEQDASFIKFAQFFCDNASVLTASIPSGDGIIRPSVYRSNEYQFTFDYYNQILDRKTQKVVNTPARIGHNSGVIEISKECFLRYSVPMRMIILLHEYSHKWKNPENGRKIGYETGADIAALNMYLSLGYSDLEAHQAFLTVFRGANNAVNKHRYLIIKDFISKYKSGNLPKYVVDKPRGNKTVSL